MGVMSFDASRFVIEPDKESISKDFSIAVSELEKVLILNGYRIMALSSITENRKVMEDRDIIDSARRADADALIFINSIKEEPIELSGTSETILEF